MKSSAYIGRFAPSPTGALHAGSVVTALASFLDARAHRGQWLLRIEDIDPPREVQGASVQIIQTLQALGLCWDGDVTFQSQNTARYEDALVRLKACGQAYPCGCSRTEIARRWQAMHPASRSVQQEWPYPGTCRQGMVEGRAVRSWRLRVPTGIEVFADRRCGERQEDVSSNTGDFVLRRADGLWAYQLAVVIDDAAQGVTDIVRGEDLLDSTARQRVLQRALGLSMPRTLHVGLVMGDDGQKLSKQNGAVPVSTARPLEVLGLALRTLGLPEPSSHNPEDWLQQATASWAARWGISP
ncbi:MAG: tRNA glutamyl-Q(34) synthetase GluQRS [Burkholderiaceae bacterium]